MSTKSQILVGIVARRIRVPGRDDVVHGVFESFSSRLVAAGAASIVIPLNQEPMAILSGVDGLVLAGGEDPGDPKWWDDGYPQDPIDEARDKFEAKIASCALGIGVPILGICRGMQMLNCALGGTLRRLECDGELLHSNSAAEGYQSDDVIHDVEVCQGSLLHSIVGERLYGVISRHAVAVSRLGNGLIATAVAADGVVEALEAKKGLAIGVQWHAEMRGDREGDGLFAWLVHEARAFRAVHR